MVNDSLPKAFIKFGKFEYMRKYIDEGELRFSTANEFCNMLIGNDKIADKFEGSFYYSATNLCIAPVYSDDVDGIDFGDVTKIDGEFNLRITNQTIQHIPIHCLYSYDGAPMNALVRLDNYDQLVSGFGDYNTAVIIYRPREFLDKLRCKFKIYAESVKYTDRTPLETEVENMAQCLYYKRREFAEQKEFRISLPDEQIKKAENYVFGSLLDVAYSVPLNILKKGFIIAENEAELERIKRRYDGTKLEFGECKKFYDVRNK